jgi:hypothetical protein
MEGVVLLNLPTLNKLKVSYETRKEKYEKG